MSDAPTGDPFSNESGLLRILPRYPQAVWFAMIFQRWLWWGYWKFNYPFGSETESTFKNTIVWSGIVANVRQAEGAEGQIRLYQKALTSAPLCGWKAVRSRQEALETLPGQAEAQAERAVSG